MEEFLNSKAVALVLPFAEAIGIMVLGFVLSKILMGWIKKLLAKTKIESMLHNFIIHGIQILIWVVVILSALNKLGIDSTSVVTVLAACGAAVALALQGSLSNLAGGILIMVSHPFSTNDYICACGVEGTVESIDLLYTTVITADKRTITIPNGSLTSNTIINNTKEGTRRVEVEVGVSYNSDTEAARYILTKLAREDSRVFDDPAPYCVVNEYADSAVVLILRCFCSAANYWDVKFALQNNIKGTLEDAGIEIPFPQVDVHMQPK